MFIPWTLFLVVLGYLILLFVIAYYAERKEKSGRSIVSNPYVYSLSLAVYCTSWTFYGSVGKAATSGLHLAYHSSPYILALPLWHLLVGCSEEDHQYRKGKQDNHNLRLYRFTVWQVPFPFGPCHNRCCCRDWALPRASD